MPSMKIFEKNKLLAVKEVDKSEGDSVRDGEDFLSMWNDKAGQVDKAGSVVVAHQKNLINKARSKTGSNKATTKHGSTSANKKKVTTVHQFVCFDGAHTALV